MAKHFGMLGWLVVLAGLARRAALAFGVAVGLLLSSAFAQEIGAPPPPATNSPQPPVSVWNGSFSDRIEIAVPAFRGLEPNLTLTYDSSRGVRNIPSAGGILGVGWSVGGLSTIERVSGSVAPAAGTDVKPNGRGVPAYGAAGLPADGYVLDGAELVLCAHVQNQSSTPSCAVPVAAGQTAYTSRNETYDRIRQIPASNSWEVTGKSGVKSLYTSLEGSDPTQTFRWHLSSVTDRRGNHTDYAWSCNATFECTISTIKTFNQGSSTPTAEIVFFTEARTDVISHASGKDIRRITQRIKAIDIRQAGNRLRTYAFSYQQSPSTGLSRLTQVQQFGRDASIDASGNVTGPTSLPPTIMTYSDLAGTTMTPAFSTNGLWINYKESQDPGPSPFPVSTGDFNGDSLRNDHHRPSIKIVVGTTGGGGQNPIYGCGRGFMNYATGTSNDANPNGGIGFGCYDVPSFSSPSGFS